MYFFERIREVPAVLRDDRTFSYRSALAEIFSLDDDESAQRRAFMLRHSIEDDEKLLAQLYKQFSGKCAFCETYFTGFDPYCDRPLALVGEGMSVYRFRPIEEAGPIEDSYRENIERAHLYYTWLINDWTNLYTICRDCQPDEANASKFPMSRGKRIPLPTKEQVLAYLNEPGSHDIWADVSSERPLFLDPCRDTDFRKHLGANVDGTVLGLSRRGAATIDHFDLNRRDLVEKRNLAFNEFLQSLKSILRRDDFETEECDDLFNFGALEFGGLWYLLLARIGELAVAEGVRQPLLGSKKISRFFNSKRNDRSFLIRLEAAMKTPLYAPNDVPGHTRKSGSYKFGNEQLQFLKIRNFKSIENLDISLTRSSDGSRSSQPNLNPSGAVKQPIESHSATLAPTLMILGENAVGKSSILEAIAFLLCGSAAREALNLKPSRFVTDQGMLGGDTQENPDALILSAHFSNENSVSYNEDFYGNNVAAGNSDNAPNIGMPVPVLAYGAFRNFISDDIIIGDTRSKKRSWRIQDPIKSLFRNGETLEDPEPWLVGLHRDRPGTFNDVRRAINQILSMDNEADGIIVRDNRCFLQATILGSNGLKSYTPFYAISSGFRSVLAMACHICRGLTDESAAGDTTLARTRAVVLIDEIEAHLHPRWRMRIIRGLREALPAVTFIMTTHDPLCLRGLSSDEVVVLRRTHQPDDKIRPTKIEKITNVPPISSLTIEQLLTSDLFSLFSTDDPGMAMTLAEVGDFLARPRGTEQSSREHSDVRSIIAKQVADSVPLGGSVVERLIQGAIEDHLIDLRTTHADGLPELEAGTRNRIVGFLKGVLTDEKS
ncbi:AAA family ATPase [Ruegeria atlantica]|uniref:AAA family ATPase n=1 Tax=Ruegeria atlantica TaxID=81569 RepID=UPI0024959CA6|nr:AAA family ATPase [Ruegeria atlantica]